MTTTIFAKNFRGFREIEICLKENLFLVGDNSSGKTSVLHLVDFVLKSDLDGLPRLEGNAGVAPNDFFSPYFDYSDVIIGFETAPTNEDPRSWKAITIHRGKDGTPSVTAVTIARGQWAITAVPHKFGAKIRARKEQSPINRDLLLSLHSDRSAMKIVQIDDERRLSINSSITLQFCIQKAYGELLDDDDLAMTLFVSCPENSRHLGPLRGKAERYYHPDRRYRSSGVHFAPMFRDVKGPRASEMKAAIEKFGIASRLFDEFTVEPVSKSVFESLLIVTMRRNGKKFLIHQVGVGVSQVAPIIVEAAFTIASGIKSVLLIQQPELHLHPIAQAALGEFLYEINNQGIMTVCETHSDYMIDRYRALIREAESSAPCSVIYFSNDDLGNHYTHVKIDKDGKLINPPKDYFDFFISEFARTAF